MLVILLVVSQAFMMPYTHSAIFISFAFGKIIDNFWQAYLVSLLVVLPSVYFGGVLAFLISRYLMRGSF